MSAVSKLSLYILTFAVLALYLPQAYDSLMLSEIEKTHLLYSPVLKKFIYTEKAASNDAEAAARADDHHAAIVYKDEDGLYYDRLEFEALLPFIYYRNMEIRGLLPLSIDGKLFDKESIEKERQVLQLAARNIEGKNPEEDLWPLFEARPEQARLLFPDDRCRFTKSRLEFVNADSNRVDEELTGIYTQSLKDRGFVFPARHVSGTFTILKAFDNGVLVVDGKGKLFHLMRIDNKPQVELVPLPEGIIPRHIDMSESSLYHGLLLDINNNLHLMLRDAYELISLPLDKYNPDTMDFKIILDPLYKTAVYADDLLIRGLVMNRDWQSIETHEHLMSRGVRTWQNELKDLLFPFSLQLERNSSSMINLEILPGAYLFNYSLLIGLGLFLFYARWRALSLKRADFWLQGIVFCFASFYALIACLCIEQKQSLA